MLVSIDTHCIFRLWIPTVQRIPAHRANVQRRGHVSHVFTQRETYIFCLVAYISGSDFIIFTCSSTMLANRPCSGAVLFLFFVHGIQEYGLFSRFWFCTSHTSSWTTLDYVADISMTLSVSTSAKPPIVFTHPVSSKCALQNLRQCFSVLH